MSDAAESRVQPAPEAAAGGGLRKGVAAMLIPVVAGLALGAAGATGWFLVASRGAPPAGAAAPHGAPEPAAADEPAETGHAAAGDAELGAEAQAEAEHGGGAHGGHADAEPADDAPAADTHASSGHADPAPDAGPAADSGHGGGSGHAASSSHGGGSNRGSGHGETPDANGKGPSWKLDPIVTNLVSDGAPLLLKLSVELGFASEEARDEAEQSVSVVRDALLTLVSSRRVADLTSFEGKVLLKEDIRMRLNHLLDGPQVESVLVTEFVVQ